MRVGDEEKRLLVEIARILPAVVVHVRRKDRLRDAGADDDEEEWLVDDGEHGLFERRASHAHLDSRTSASARLVHLERGLLHSFGNGVAVTFVGHRVQANDPVEAGFGVEVNHGNGDFFSAGNRVLGRVRNLVHEMHQIDRVDRSARRFGDEDEVAGLGSELEQECAQASVSEELHVVCTRLGFELEPSIRLAVLCRDRGARAFAQPFDENVEDCRGQETARRHVQDLCFPAVLREKCDVVGCVARGIGLDFAHEREITRHVCVIQLQPFALDFGRGRPNAVCTEFTVSGLEGTSFGQGRDCDGHVVFLLNE